MRLQPLIGVAMAVTGLLFMAGTASAHAEFVASTPAPDSVLTAPPAQVTVVFTQAIMRSSTVTVIGPGGATVSGATVVSNNTATAPVQAAGPGVYQVQWANVSAEDGHERAGAFQFTVAAPVPAPAPALPPAAPAPRPAPAAASVTATQLMPPRTGTGMAAGTDAPAALLSALALALIALGPALTRRLARRTARTRN